MTRNQSPEHQWPHEVQVIFGSTAVQAYLDGEHDEETLSMLGRIKTYRFKTVPELNAFIHGVEEARGHANAVAVDDLTAPRSRVN